MDKFIKPLLAVLAFMLIQALGGIVLGIVRPGILTKGAAAYPNEIAILLLATSVLTVMLIWLGMKMLRVPEAFSAKGISPRMTLMTVVAALTGIIATDFLSEFADLPNLMEDEMMGMANSVVGALAIAVVGPVTEEIVFREAIIGHMLKRGAKVWVAIIFSALCFGIIHFNPAQVPFAFAVGLILGIIYVCTGNILLTSIIHILNNSIAVVEMNVLGDKAKDFSYIDMLGGKAIAAVVIVICATICIWLLRKVWVEQKS